MLKKATAYLVILACCSIATSTIPSSVLADINSPFLQHEEDVQSATKLLVEDILSATKLFESDQTQIIEGTSYLKLVKLGNKTFFGIRKDHQSFMNYELARKVILQQLNLPIHSKIYQVLGDSAKYHKAGTEFAREYLNKHLEKAGLVLWGFTGYGTASHERDANQLVSDWIDLNQAGHRSLANVVDFNTIEALTKWKNQGSLANRNFFLVHDQGTAKFGDDVISSDFITDLGICFDGGIQSFRQIVNLLSRNVETYGCYNLRGDNHPASFDPISQTYKQYFSAAEFFDQLKTFLLEKQASGEEPSVRLVEQFKEAYIKEQPLFKFNPKKPVADKAALFETGWKQFMDEELWRRLDLCNFTKFVPVTEHTSDYHK